MTPIPESAVLHLAPVNDFLIVERIDSPFGDGSKIYQVHRDPNGPQYVRVLAVGPGRNSEYSAEPLPMLAVKPGDILLTGAGVGMACQSSGQTVHFILPRDVWAVVTVA